MKESKKTIRKYVLIIYILLIIIITCSLSINILLDLNVFKYNYNKFFNSLNYYYFFDLAKFNTINNLANCYMFAFMKLALAFVMGLIVGDKKYIKVVCY